MEKKYFYLLISISIILITLLFIKKDDGPNFFVTLTPAEVREKQDTDGDGTPDWLEYLIGSDLSNPKSFPYARDIALINEITIDDLVYGGPGTFTEEITKRFLLGEENEITNAEKEEFIKTSTEYFLSKTNKRSLPAINVSVNQNIDYEIFLVSFLEGIRAFLNTKARLENLILEVLLENDEYFVLGRTKRDECKNALEILPTEVPEEIYAQYHAIIERITYLCHALDISFTNRSTETYFYVIRLLTEGKLVLFLFENQDKEFAFENLLLQIVGFLDEKSIEN